MCYSAETSIKTLIINHISAILLYYTFDPAIATYLIFVGIMQFWDYIFWKNQEKNAINYWSTKMAMLNNNFQPIILGLSMYLFNHIQFNYFSILIFFLYFLITIFYCIYSWFSIDYTLVTKASAPGLFWQWNFLPGGPYYYALYFITTCILMYNYAYPIKYILIILYSLSFFFSYFKYNTLDVGRMWCFLFAFSPIFILLIYILLEQKEVKRIFDIRL